jgi:hypothetical protein
MIGADLLGVFPRISAHQYTYLAPRANPNAWRAQVYHAALYAPAYASLLS